MIPTEGTPIRSPDTASCKLHDEQLPQSPTAATRAFHSRARSMISGSAGAE
jgi:hypothetical protein